MASEMQLDTDSKIERKALCGPTNVVVEARPGSGFAISCANVYMYVFVFTAIIFNTRLEGLYQRPCIFRNV